MPETKEQWKERMLEKLTKVEETSTDVMVEEIAPPPIVEEKPEVESAPLSNEIIFLASPYTHADLNILTERYDKVMEIVSRLFRKGIHAFSPIQYCHQMAVRYSLPKDVDFWEKFDQKFILRSAEVWVVMMDSWDISEGVKRETLFAKMHSRPVRYLDPITLKVEDR